MRGVKVNRMRKESSKKVEKGRSGTGKKLLSRFSISAKKKVDKKEQIVEISNEKEPFHRNIFPATKMPRISRKSSKKSSTGASNALESEGNKEEKAKKRILGKMSKLVPNVFLSSKEKNCDGSVSSVSSVSSVTATLSTCSSSHSASPSIEDSDSFDSVESREECPVMELPEALGEQSLSTHQDARFPRTLSCETLASISEDLPLRDHADSSHKVVVWMDEPSLATSSKPRLVISAVLDDMSSTGTTDSDDSSFLSGASSITDNDDYHLFCDNDDDSTAASSVDTSILKQKIEDLAFKANQQEYHLSTDQPPSTHSQDVLLLPRDPPQAPQKSTTNTQHAQPTQQQQTTHHKLLNQSSINATLIIFLLASLLSRTTCKLLRSAFDLAVTVASSESPAARRRRRRKWKHTQDKHQLFFFITPLVLAIKFITVLFTTTMPSLHQNYLIQFMANNPCSPSVSLGINGCIKSFIFFWFMTQGQRQSISYHQDNNATTNAKDTQLRHVRHVHFASSNTVTH